MILLNQVIAEPMSTNGILFLTNELRRKFDLYSVSYFPIVEFIENVLPRIDSNFSYHYVDKSEMLDKYAYFDNSTNTMVIREDVYESALAGNGRDRFTLAHELGHYILHSSGVQLCRSDGGHVVAFCDPEWQANTFASKLLMPDHLIYGLTPSEVSRNFGTSYQAAEIALKKAKKAKLAT